MGNADTPQGVAVQLGKAIARLRVAQEDSMKIRLAALQLN
jgi:hypothetical protein